MYRSEHVSQCQCAYNITTGAVNGGEPSVATRDRSQAAEKRNPRKERADDRAGKEHGRVGEGCKQGGGAGEEGDGRYNKRHGCDGEHELSNSIAMYTPKHRNTDNRRKKESKTK